MNVKSETEKLLPHRKESPETAKGSGLFPVNRGRNVEKGFVAWNYCGKNGGNVIE